LKGFVPTPNFLVDVMVEKLFRGRILTAEQKLLDPGCGTGAFIDGVLRWCRDHGAPVPQITGVEADPHLLDLAREQLRAVQHVTLLRRSFLAYCSEQYDYIVGNPPYVPITDLSDAEKSTYRRIYLTARGRFDLYQLFFEQALRQLKPSGRLVFVTPEKFLYVQTAEQLRKKLADFAIEEIELIDEAVFGDLVTYPTITTVSGESASRQTRVILRDRTIRTVRLAGGESWLPVISGGVRSENATTLESAFLRISCGVATGADNVFVVPDSSLPSELRDFAHPTVSGRELIPGEPVETSHSMLLPYGKDGTLLPERELGPLGEYLGEPLRKDRLLRRTCVLKKPWYAFHETPPLNDLLKPKILCKDIGQRPMFFPDFDGLIVPRHSVYYLVPRLSDDIGDLCTYLNSAAAAEWLRANCQRAANGFVRLQSHVLKRMPLPEELARTDQLTAV
jgi:adenine-specific DNA-methyltransferase